MLGQTQPPADPTWPLGFDSCTSPLIRAVPTLGSLLTMAVSVGGHIRSFTQAQRSLTIVRLFSICISKLVPVVLPEANRLYLALFPSSFPKTSSTTLCHSLPSCLLSPASEDSSQEVAEQPCVVPNSISRIIHSRYSPTFLTKYFQLL